MRKFITCEIQDEGLLRDLDIHAKILHVKRSDVIRMALYDYVEKYNDFLVVAEKARRNRREVDLDGNQG